MIDKEEERNRPLKDGEGHPLAWPLRTDGNLGIRRFDAKKLNFPASHGYTYASSYDEKRGTYTIRYIFEDIIQEIASGMITQTGAGGTKLITDFLCERNAFFPKSLYSFTLLLDEFINKPI